MINVQKLSVDDAVDIICNTISINKFRTTPESKQSMDDLALAVEVKAVLMDKVPPKEVTAQNGIISVTIQASSILQEAEFSRCVEELCKTVEGIKQIKVESLPYIQSFE